MKIGLTADLHVSVDRLDDFKLLFKDLATLAVEQDLDAMYFLGDMWHEKHTVDSQVLNLIYNGGKAIPCECVWIRGNHEVELKSHPHQRSYISLFDSVYRVISAKHELIYRLDDGLSLWGLPWFIPEELKKRVAWIAKQPGRKLLFSHTAVNEGFVSASNSYRPETGVKLADLHPDLFAMILLGDYHISQILGDNVLYLGTPIPLAHGDKEHGIWVLELGTGKEELVPVNLPSVYPQFITYDFCNDNQLGSIDYNPYNYNKFIVPQDSVGKLQKMYGGGPKDTWEIIVPETAPNSYRARATQDELSTPVLAFEKWLKIRGLFGDKDLHTLGLEYLNRHKIGK